MQTRPLTLITTASALAASSLAHAHGSGSADSSVYHYLSSPDHVIGFVVLGVVALALALQLLRKASAVVQRVKR
ncbi:MAG: hypothetical protein IPG64_07515 [Haliea sp.]|jgi:hypothetical protein|nr:hypothetical protein [Haliea sp.]MBK6737762.1 hypothetical protein [Haliea sp.]